LRANGKEKEIAQTVMQRLPGLILGGEGEFPRGFLFGGIWRGVGEKPTKGGVLGRGVKVRAQ